MFLILISETIRVWSYKSYLESWYCAWPLQWLKFVPKWKSASIYNGGYKMWFLREFKALRLYSLTYLQNHKKSNAESLKIFRGYKRASSLLYTIQDIYDICFDLFIKTIQRKNIYRHAVYTFSSKRLLVAILFTVFFFNIWQFIKLTSHGNGLSFLKLLGGDYSSIREDTYVSFKMLNWL